MKFSYTWLKELHPKIKSPKETADMLTFHAFQVESAEPKGNDTVLDIDILPNRFGDASGHLGVARELAVIAGGEFRLPAAKFKEEKEAASSTLSVKIEAGKAVPRYAARVVRTITVKDAPLWMQERLISCGLRPINIVVDVTNFVMLETGQPLHAFDYDRLHGAEKKEIIVRFAKKEETMQMLGEGGGLKLENTDIVIMDKKGVLGLAGIKGAKGSEIHPGTKTIVIEAANFDPAAIRRTSKRLGLRTDASIRFEHGLDVERIDLALKRAAELIQKFAGGTVLKGAVDAGRKLTPTRSIPFEISRAEKLLGISIPEAPALSILKRLGCETKKRGKGSYRVTPPSFRQDLVIQEDLIEEVGRVRGYEKIPAELPHIRGGVPEKHDRQIFEDQIKERLAGYGFTELQLSSFIGESSMKPYGLTPPMHYELENPVNPESRYLVHIAPIPYIEAMAENLRHEKRVQIFGIGRGFWKSEKGPVERARLILGLAEEGSDRTFYELKGFVDELLESFRVNDYAYDDTASDRHRAWAHPYRVAEIRLGNDLLGVIGEVKREVLSQLKSRARIVIAELDIERMLTAIEAEFAFRPFSRYPAVERDVAVIVPETTKVESVTNVIEEAGGELLVDSDLFDDFQDEGMRARGVQSLAFHLSFQAEDRTLTDEEVNKLHRTIIEALKQNSWEVR